LAERFRAGLLTPGGESFAGLRAAGAAGSGQLVRDPGGRRLAAGVAHGRELKRTPLKDR